MADLTVFSSTYAEARGKFLDTARVAGARLTQIPHPTAHGPQDEPLYLDVAVLGEADAPNVMLVGCGTHGIEGFSGSAAQTAWIAGGGATRVAAGSAMVFICMPTIPGVLRTGSG